jgi:hypothetical protein
MNAAAPRVFISYRREDASGHAGRLYDAVAGRLGDANVFMDVEMEPGIDFVERITQVVGACRVLLAVIGPEWASPGSGETEPRIADPNDFVRLEVRAGLRRSDVSVIPLLVAGARMPDPDGLPEDLRALARVNALELSDLRWRYDVGRLMSHLDELLGSGAAPTVAPASAARDSSAAGAPTAAGARALARRPAVIAGALGALALVLVTIVIALSAGDSPETSPPSTGTGDALALTTGTPPAARSGVGVNLSKDAQRATVTFSGEGRDSTRRATLRFHGAKDQRIAPDVRNLRGSLEGVVRIEDTDGGRVLEYGLQNGLLLSERCPSARGCQPGTLPQDGTYTVIVETTAGTAGSLALRVYQVPNDDERETRIGARPTLLNLDPGQQASIAFGSPAAGAHVLLLLRDIEIRQFEVRLADPDQRPVWPHPKILDNSKGTEDVPLALTRKGTYTLYFRGDDREAGGLSAQLQGR